MPVGPILFKILVAGTLLVGLAALAANLAPARGRARRAAVRRPARTGTVHTMDARPAELGRSRTGGRRPGADP